MTGRLEATIIAAFGRQYEVELDSGELMLCFPRAKKSLCACGDRVEISETAPQQGVIERLLPRSSLLYREDAFKQKLIAANLSQIIIVTAVEPSFSPELLTRCLCAAEDQSLKALIVLNKCDLSDHLEDARALLAPLRAIGYPILELSARSEVGELARYLPGEISLLVGQSGMGKSTLTNALIPDAEARTREISDALNSGKHTTTFSRLYRLPEGGALIDSPGLQMFGLAHLAREALEHSFKDFRPFLGQCRFRDCRHETEPGCALRDALEQGKIQRQRLDHFRLLRSELEKALQARVGH